MQALIEHVPPIDLADQAVREDQAFTLSFVREPEEFAGLRPEWQALTARNFDNQLVFQSFSWLECWLASHDDPTSELAIVVGRLAGRAVLIAPLVVQQRLGLRHLIWMGTPVSQYGDIITAGETVSDAMIDEAMSFAIVMSEPDLIHLTKVRGDARIRTWLGTVGAEAMAHNEAPFLSFEPGTSFDAYCAKFTAKARKNRRRLRRRLEELGPVSIKVLEPGDEAAEMIAKAIDFKRQWLTRRGIISTALRDHCFQQSLTRFAATSDPASRPFVSVMSCSGMPVSIQFGIIANNRLALHMIAYNPDYEKSGVGVLHIESTLEHCITNGLGEMDFLSPNAAYKAGWSDDMMAVDDFAVARSLGARAYVMSYLRGTRDAAKHALETLPSGLRCYIAGWVV